MAEVGENKQPEQRRDNENDNQPCNIADCKCQINTQRRCSLHEVVLRIYLLRKIRLEGIWTVHPSTSTPSIPDNLSHIVIIPICLETLLLLNCSIFSNIQDHHVTQILNYKIIAKIKH